MRRGDQVTGSLTITVHGPAGVLDLLVPAEAAALDVAREYAAQAGATSVPALHTNLGARLRPDDVLVDVGVGTGDVLVATGPVVGSGVGSGGGSGGASPDGRPAAAPTTPTGPSTPAGPPGPLSVLWCGVAAAAAALAGWFAALTSGAAHEAAVGLLVLAAVLGILPVGRYARHRVLAAPVFAGAAALAVVWAPETERLPTVLGVAALVAAVTAAAGRALDRSSEEALGVWVAGGVGVFVLGAGCALLGFGPPVVWAVVLLAATLGARFVPGFAIDVPDSYLLDIERLAVTAWSARERPRGRRGRTLVPEAAVAAVAERGARVVTAACAAILVLAAVATPLLLGSATLPVDRLGARVQVLLSGAALLFAARSYRHAGARGLLRAAGLSCWVWLLVHLVGGAGVGLGAAPVLVAVGLSALMVVVAVATGRGWRSAWWSRRAEVAESLATAGAIATVLVSIGLVRSLWELTLQV